MMDEKQKPVQPQPVKYTNPRLVCGQFQALKRPENVLVRVKPKPVGDWAIIADME